MGVLREFVQKYFRNRFRTIHDVYARSAPSAQNAVNVFQGEWVSRFPAPYTELTGGTAPLFDDPRISWALSELGGIEGQSVLELGPFEGGHSYMLDQAGAKSILGIEANSRSHLRCLIAKEILGIRHASFQLGDFTEYLEACSTPFDFILASGVLYHMKDPVRLLKLISKNTRRAYIWTHYYDESITRTHRRLPRNFSATTTAELDGLKVVLHRHEYGRSLRRLNFLGGTAPYSHWMEQKDILACVKHFGFNKITVGKDEPNHRNGPSFEFVAVKT
jgi:Methyltransferase domain